MPFMVPHTLPRDEVTDHAVLTIVRRVVPPATVDDVVTQYGAPHRRTRKLPGDLLLLLFVAMHLMPPMALELVLEVVLVGRQLQASEPSTPAGKSGISHARYRWGARPLVALFHQRCQPLATAETIGAWYAGLRIMALDSSIDDVADSPANAHVFGRHRGGKGAAGYPQLLGMYLLECGTRAIIDAGFWPCHTDVHRAARRVVRSVRADMLLLWDQGLHSYALTQAVQQRGAAFLGRVPSGQTFEPVRCLPDGSLLARLWAAPPSSRTAQTEARLVRVLTYTLLDPHRPGYQLRHRLMTSLLDPTQHPARTLILLYHERWQIEGAFAEHERVQRLAVVPFRAHNPVGVMQEAYGLLLAHYAVRAVMHDAALAAGCDPDRLSFTAAFRLIAAFLPLFQLVPSREHPILYHGLLTAITRHQVPERPYRATPRVRKRPRSTFPTRTSATPQTVRLQPFADTIELLPNGGLSTPAAETARA